MPFFGCFLSYGTKPRQFLTSISNDYGPITSVPLLQANNIFINDAKLAKRLLKDKRLANHWQNHNKLREIGGFDIENGEKWTQRRKYVSQTLFSILKSSFVLNHVKESINDYFQNNPIDKIATVKMKKIVSYIALNNVFSAIFGKNLSYNDPFIKDMTQATFKKFESIGPLILIDLSFNTKLPDWLMWSISDHRKNEKFLDDVIIGWMSNNNYTVDLDKNIIKRDDSQSNKQEMWFIDNVIDKLNANKITANEIISDIGIIITAAIDTTAASSEYGFLLLAKYPDIQEIVYQEINEIMNKNNYKEFDLKMLKEAHKFKAFIHEMLRISCVAPTGVPHQIHEDFPVKLDDGNEYILPKNSLINYNTYFMMKKRSWDDSQKIYSTSQENDSIHLDYWLDENDKFKLNDNFILFGSGVRDCVGQSLAKNAIYSMFGILMTKYKFIAPNNNPDLIQLKQEWNLVLTIDPSIPITIQSRT